MVTPITKGGERGGEVSWLRVYLYFFLNLYLLIFMNLFKQLFLFYIELIYQNKHLIFYTFTYRIILHT